MENVSVQPVVLKACGEFCGYNCGDCLYLDLSRPDNKGNYYCPKMAQGSFRKYVYPGEKPCRHFVER